MPRELARLAELLGRTADDALVRLSHYTTEPAARKLEKTHPQLAARLWRAQGLRIINAGKSKYYDAALSNFERAMHCFVKASQLPEWEKTVRTLRAEHRRKTGFLAGFEELVSGQGPSEKPSYLERAKMHFWHGSTHETRNRQVRSLNPAGATSKDSLRIWITTRF